MSAGLIVHKAVADASGSQGRVQHFRVMVLHDGVVLAGNQEDGWAVLGDVLLDRERVAHLSVELPIFAQQGAPGTLMAVGMRHAHHWIDGCNEVRTRVGLLSGKHCQMSTGREAHHANLPGIDMILVGMFTDVGYGLLDIVERVWILMTSVEQAGMGEV